MKLVANFDAIHGGKWDVKRYTGLCQHYNGMDVLRIWWQSEVSSLGVDRDGYDKGYSYLLMVAYRDVRGDEEERLCIDAWQDEDFIEFQDVRQYMPLYTYRLKEGVALGDVDEVVERNLSFWLVVEGLEGWKEVDERINRMIDDEYDERFLDEEEEEEE